MHEEYKTKESQNNLQQLHYKEEGKQEDQVKDGRTRLRKI